MHLNGIFFKKLIFWILLKPVIILTWYVKANETMVINKFKKPQNPRSLILESHQHIKTYFLRNI